MLPGTYISAINRLVSPLRFHIYVEGYGGNGESFIAQGGEDSEFLEREAGIWSEEMEWDGGTGWVPRVCFGIVNMSDVSDRTLGNGAASTLTPNVKAGG